ncbi:hypothetical protein OGZ51_11595 [Lactococcus lactis]|uniref:YobI-like P-loop NTPase domain-containing protein n=1 Tax=Lactococcus lactis TaxID=1358 RepID=A0A9X4S5J2_9LACT|nr:hypothetical protein [Lactococcus lactis]MDG4984788.1 hypothetical protein [Lactococcus lactis]
MNELKEEEGELRLHPLTPNDKREDVNSYKLYFDEALKNEKIKNIALSGNYGSGKSSILLTYFNGSEYENKKMQISLANFNSGSTNPKDNLLNIEKNIINQILYQIPVSKIPLTNFKIKREISSLQKIFILVEIILILSLVFKKSEVMVFVSSLYEKYISHIGISPIIYSILLLLMIWNVWMLLKYVPIKKINLKFQNVEAEINKKNDELFEKYADEIVYLLEKSGKEILVIEDLDRFKQLKIFEKLRELNVKVNDKLNSSNKNKFTFIYAIKDDLFNDKKERTKFFDLIIPVIPYLNATNSYEKLKSMFAKNYTIDDNLVYLLSFYIDDMRLLLNIYNEFVVYRDELGDEDFNEDDKLLSLIVYKNLFYKDYEDLKFRKGELYNIVTSVEKYRDEIRNQILKAKKELADAEEQREFKAAKTHEDVLTLWLKNNMYQNYSFGDINSFINNPQRNFYYLNNGQPINTTYEELQKDTDYQHELALALKEETITEKVIKDNISVLEKKLRSKLKDIISEDAIPEDKSLVYRLITQGYIDESYEKYINYSYAEKNDDTFLKNLFSNGKAIDFDVELNDFNKIIKVLTDVDYKKEVILNNSLLNYFIEKKDTRHIDEILNTSIKHSIGFIEQYYNKYSNILEHLVRLNIKIDLTKINIVDEKLIENYLFIEDETNFEFLILNNWKDKISNEEQISETINDKSLSNPFKVYYIPKLRRKVDLKNIDSDYYDSLLKNNKIIPSSENIDLYFKFSSDIINQILVEFINQNDLNMNFQMDKEFFDKLINTNEISNNKYKVFFEEYQFEGYSRELLDDNIKKEKLEILINLDKLVLSYDMVKFLDAKNIAYINNNEKKLSELLIENKDLDIKNWKTILDSNILNDVEKKKLFIARIDEFNFEEFKKLIIQLHFNEKLLKVINKQHGYHSIRFENTESNLVIKEYLANNNIIRENILNKMFEEK